MIQQRLGSLWAQGTARAASPAAARSHRARCAYKVRVSCMRGRATRSPVQCTASALFNDYIFLVSLRETQPSSTCTYVKKKHLSCPASCPFSRHMTPLQRYLQDAVRTLSPSCLSHFRWTVSSQGAQKRTDERAWHWQDLARCRHSHFWACSPPDVRMFAQACKHVLCARWCQ